MNFTRRQFLASATAAAAMGAAAPLFIPNAAAAAAKTRLIIDRRTIEVGGKAASVYGLRQPGGSPGFIGVAGERFDVMLENRLAEPALIHWHGQTPPLAQDGVPGLSQPPLAAGASHAYDFALRPGTHWMHSHSGLQEQKLMAAPLIVREDASADVQDVVVLLHDFTFKEPDEILAGLRGGQGPHGAAMEMDHSAHGMMNHGAMSQAPMDHSMMMGMGGGMTHYNDVEYDAYLANDRTLDDPEVVRVESGGRVRLRIINGATATAFLIDLGSLPGEVVAVDGNPVRPLMRPRLPIAMGQRLDVMVTLPPGEGAYPILALREGDVARTGIILATPNAGVARIPSQADFAAGPVGLDLEMRLAATKPLAPRAADRQLTLTLGEAPGYIWTIDGATYGAHQSTTIRRGERVEVTFRNMTPMMHPMHLHGHHYQVVGIDRRRFSGAVRDTVIAPPMGSVTVAFDAVNPGEWAVHCHNLYHMAMGMMTTVKYEA